MHFKLISKPLPKISFSNYWWKFNQYFDAENFSLFEYAMTKSS